MGGKEGLPSGAQLRFTDIDASISPASPPGSAAVSSPAWSSAVAGHAAKTGSFCAKDTGLRSLPLEGSAQNQIWCELVAPAGELLAWMPMLSFTGPPTAGNPSACGAAYSPSPDGWHRAVGGSGSASPDAGLGRAGRNPPPAGARRRLTTPHHPT